MLRDFDVELRSAFAEVAGLVLGDDQWAQDGAVQGDPIAHSSALMTDDWPPGQR